ncbi:MAG: hypothetical protein HYV26_12505 [Candidatus Hydrogenedentes bacterium]|nr:hypothetical protein [Candidatus Hydrogenedentota bacterium]
MGLIDFWILGATSVFFVVGLVIVFWGGKLREKGKSVGRAVVRNPVLESTCSICQRPMAFQTAELRPLQGVEVALVVSARADVTGHKLAEYTCPYCEAAHCFVLDRKGPRWLGANIMQPEVKASVCLECRKPLRRPPWPAEAYEGKLPNIPQISGDIGLVCQHCHAVCCVACCEKTTRGRAAGALLCPRCFRAPINTVFQP